MGSAMRLLEPSRCRISAILGYDRINSERATRNGNWRRTHDAPLVDRGVGFSGAQAGFGQLQVFDNFGDHLLHMWQPVGAERLHHQVWPGPA